MKWLRTAILTAALLSLIPLSIRAQYDVAFAHYQEMLTAYNPAAAGRAPKLNVTAGYAMQMVGFEHNPQTMYVAADMPVLAVNTQHGLGVQMMSDNIGLFAHQRLSAQYALRLKMLGGWLALGAQAGMLTEKFKGSGLDLDEGVGTDQALPNSDVDGNSLDIAVGLYYSHGPWYVGASAQHMNSPKVKLSELNELKIDATYYLNAGCDFKLRNPRLSISTAGMARYDGVMFRGDVSARLVYNYEGRYMYAGLGCSPTNSFTVYLGGQFHGVMLGYSYEAYMGGMNIGNGSHELIIGYQTDVNLGKKGRNKHQSVRYL